jgi:hypothetical protein
MAGPEIRIAGERLSVLHGRLTVATTSLGRALETVAKAEGRGPGWRVLPRGVRIWEERGDAVAVAVEVPPHARTVRWLAEDSRQPYGPGASYGERFLAFPWVVLLLVLRGGALTGHQQLYYRTAPLAPGDEDLLLPNLPNVAQGYGQRCWVCLASLHRPARAPGSTLIDGVVDHVFSAAFNRSSEVNEGNSWWGAMRGLDPRVASLEAWEAATRESRHFALGVRWRKAGTTATAELRGMLDRVVAPRRPRCAEELSALLAAAPPERSAP